METVELKSSIHTIIDQIESDQLLRSLYDFLKTRENEKIGGAWAMLSNEQKQEVLAAFDESEEDSNLVDPKEVIKKRWWKRCSQKEPQRSTRL